MEITWHGARGKSQYSRHALTTRVIAFLERWDREDLTTSDWGDFHILNPPARSLCKDPPPPRIFSWGEGGVCTQATHSRGFNLFPLALGSTFTGAKAPDIQEIRLNLDSLLL